MRRTHIASRSWFPGAIIAKNHISFSLPATHCFAQHSPMLYPQMQPKSIETHTDKEHQYTVSPFSLPE